MPQAVRDRVGSNLLLLTLKELFEWRFMQTGQTHKVQPMLSHLLSLQPTSIDPRKCDNCVAVRSCRSVWCRLSLTSVVSAPCCMGHDASHARSHWVTTSWERPCRAEVLAWTATMAIGVEPVAKRPDINTKLLRAAGLVPLLAKQRPRD